MPMLPEDLESFADRIPELQQVDQDAARDAARYFASRLVEKKWPRSKITATMRPTDSEYPGILQSVEIRGHFTGEAFHHVSQQIEKWRHESDQLERLIKVLGTGSSWPHVIFNPKEGMTIVIFADGEKIISKTTKDDEFNPEVGLAMCLVKRMMSRSGFKRLVRSGHWMDNTDE